MTVNFSNTLQIIFHTRYSSSIFCSLFSMDGDYAPMVELADLRKKHGFLLVIDDVKPLDIFQQMSFFFFFFFFFF